MNGQGRAGFMHARAAVAAAALAGAVLGAWGQEAAGGAEMPQALLLKAMFRLDVAQQVANQAAKIAEPCEADVAAEIVAAAKTYQGREAGAIRDALESAFGERARPAFGDFVDAYAKASEAGNEAFLATLTEAVGGWGDAPPADYAALRQGMVQRVLREEIAAAGRFLADVQTWLDLKGRAEDVPPLAAWVDRAGEPAATTRQVVKRRKPAKRNPLRDAEAPAETFEGEPGGGEGSLEGFGAARKERREKALQDAQAGMQQVAEERRAAEEELAAKKTAAAQAEADAVRKQAEKLAAAESEAIEQRKNSWSGRLKSVLTATIGATSGAFLGNVGGRAGEAAANAIFNEEGHHGRGHDRGD